MKHSKIITVLSGLLTIGISHGAVITQWDFNASSTTPSIGSGTISLLGTATNTGYNSSAGSSDPTQPGLGYQTTTYPVQSATSGNAGIRMNVSTIGFSSGLEISFDLRTSNTSSRWYRVDYTTNGTDFTLGLPTRMGVNANAGDTWHNSNTVSITDPAALGNSNFGFRVVSVFNPNAFTEANSGTNYGANAAYEVARNIAGGSSYAGGTWRFDMVTVSAVAVPEPSSALLGGLGLLALLLRRR
jgi:hypothetical protein